MKLCLIRNRFQLKCNTYYVKYDLFESTLFTSLKNQVSISWCKQSLLPIIITTFSFHPAKAKYCFQNLFIYNVTFQFSKWFAHTKWKCLNTSVLKLYILHLKATVVYETFSYGTWIMYVSVGPPYRPISLVVQVNASKSGPLVTLIWCDTIMEKCRRCYEMLKHSSESR